MGGLGPVGPEVPAQPRHMLDDDRGVTVHDAVDLKAHRRDSAPGNMAGGDLERLRCRFALVALGDRVDLNFQPGRQLPDRAAPRHGQDTGLE